MALVDMYPLLTGDRDHLVLAEGRLLFLALQLIDSTINDAVVIDAKTRRIKVSNPSILKRRLSQLTPALASHFLNLLLIKSSDPFCSVAILSRGLARIQKLPHVCHSLYRFLTKLGPG